MGIFAAKRRNFLKLWTIFENLLKLWMFVMKRTSSIEHGGTRPFFYMVDQYFGNNSLEPFECIFMAPLALFTYNEAPKRKNVAPLAL